MADRISEARRSWNMSRIRGKDTGPELHLRSLLHQAGFRFRIHDRNLPRVSRHRTKKISYRYICSRLLLAQAFHCVLMRQLPQLAGNFGKPNSTRR